MFPDGFGLKKINVSRRERQETGTRNRNEDSRVQSTRTGSGTGGSEIVETGSNVARNSSEGSPDRR